MANDNIARLEAELKTLSDADLLARIEALPPLADESDATWDDQAYWDTAADSYLALRQAARARRLRPAASLLLDRAAYGDPGEIMRGLRHSLEAIYADDLKSLADVYLAAAKSPRLGTRMWAISGLMVLDDPRARRVFEASIQNDPPDIREIAEIALTRLVNPKKHEDEAAQLKAEFATAEEERRARNIAQDAAITSRRCVYCGCPLPSYRKTCQYCKKPAKAVGE